MLKTYLKIAYRHLLKNKVFSLVNITGLSIGLAAFFLVILYVNFEKSYDKFEGSEDIVRVYMDYRQGEGFEPGDAQTYNLSAPTLAENFPEVEKFVRFHKFEQITFKINNQLYVQKDGSLADPSSLDFMNYDLAQGDPSTALEEPNSMVISKALAEKLFGNENPIGKSILAYKDGIEANMKITGILKNRPQNTHLKNEFLISWNTVNTWDAFGMMFRKPNWNQNVFFSYLKLKKGTDFQSFQSKVMAFKTKEEAFSEERHNIERLEDIHLHSNKPYEAEANGSVARVRFLEAIAIIILVLSWLNYINLSSTNAFDKMKEVGVRKVVGARKNHLILQSMTETFLLNLVAILLAGAITYLMLPMLQLYIGAKLSFDSSLLPILGWVVLGIFISSLYPAFILSRFSILKALKGKLSIASGELNIRKGLIITQFVATVVLIIGTIMINKQIKFLRSLPTGTKLANVVAFSGEKMLRNDSIGNVKFQVLKNELNKLPFVEKSAVASTFPGGLVDDLSSTMGMTFPNGKEDEKTPFYLYSAENASYFDAVGLKLIAGNYFSESSIKNRKLEMVISEKMMREIEETNPQEVIGKTMNFWGEKWEIVGVMEDYHHFGLKKEILPIFIRNDIGVSDKLIVKFDNNAVSNIGYKKAIASVKAIWTDVFPQSTFDYQFINQQYDAQYKEDEKFGSAFSIFTSLAIFIACLGLFGLTSYTANQRKKEIGIRKVNGATVSQIVQLLNKDFMKWLAVSFVLAIPLAWFAINNWLANFPYKTTLNWWVFAAGGAVMFVIGLLTVSWHSINAALTNPVNVLKDE